MAQDMARERLTKKLYEDATAHHIKRRIFRAECMDLFCCDELKDDQGNLTGYYRTAPIEAKNLTTGDRLSEEQAELIRMLSKTSQWVEPEVRSFYAGHQPKIEAPPVVSTPVAKSTGGIFLHLEKWRESCRAVNGKGRPGSNGRKTYGQERIQLADQFETLIRKSIVNEDCQDELLDLARRQSRRGMMMAGWKKPKKYYPLFPYLIDYFVQRGWLSGDEGWQLVIRKD